MSRSIASTTRAVRILGSAGIPVTYLIVDGEVVDRLPGQRSAKEVLGVDQIASGRSPETLSKKNTAPAHAGAAIEVTEPKHARRVLRSRRARRSASPARRRLQKISDDAERKPSRQCPAARRTRRGDGTCETEPDAVGSRSSRVVRAPRNDDRRLTSNVKKYEPPRMPRF
jgi:hypothetical protein